MRGLPRLSTWLGTTSVSVASGGRGIIWSWTQLRRSSVATRLAAIDAVRGELVYEDVKAKTCRRETFTAGGGFVDRGFGWVHRAVAGPEGADFYVVYIMPPGTPNPLTGADPLEECLS